MLKITKEVFLDWQDVQEHITSEEVCEYLDTVASSGEATRILNHILAHKLNDPHYTGLSLLTDALEDAIRSRTRDKA